MSLSKALFWQDGSKVQLGSEGGTNFLSGQLEVLCAWPMPILLPSQAG